MDVVSNNPQQTHNSYIEQNTKKLMEHKLYLYNTLSRIKEQFVPIHSPNVGLYVCGPTVYGDPHLGHARAAITFDILYRWLQHQHYKVRYVRNITDVGHLENDTDEGEDKIAKKARLEELEPMEVVQHYTRSYRKAMELLNVRPPSIEPTASGHMIEQIEFIEKIIASGFAYETEGSIYFDVEKYNQHHHYGKLSGRNIDELLETTRQLDGQSEKKRSVDFALWKKASPKHIMRWNSPWSKGFPGWHVECSAMGTKYLGEEFDIHGGGMDLMFPHHECEIAQNQAGLGKKSVKYWMHNNMITVDGQKMGKSLGNFITLEEFFTGNHPHLSKAFAPMTIRFFILQAHYRSTLDFSNAALEASEKGLERLIEGYVRLQKIKADEKTSFSIVPIEKLCQEAMNDDLNTPILISHLFEQVKLINTIHDGKATIDQNDLDTLKSVFKIFVEELLGLSTNTLQSNGDMTSYQQAIDLLLEIRQDAKKNKNWAMSDKIRAELTALGFQIKDTKDGFEWKKSNQ